MTGDRLLYEEIARRCYKEKKQPRSGDLGNNSNDDNDQHNSGGRENRQLEIGSTSSGIVATKTNSTKRLFPD